MKNQTTHTHIKISQRIFKVCTHTRPHLELHFKFILNEFISFQFITLKIWYCFRWEFCLLYIGGTMHILCRGQLSFLCQICKNVILYTYAYIVSILVINVVYALYL